MSGDDIKIAVKSYYQSRSGTKINTDPVESIIASLANGIISATGTLKGGLAELTAPASPLLGALSLFRNDNNSDPSGKPKAYLNWIFTG